MQLHPTSKRKPTTHLASKSAAVLFFPLSVEPTNFTDASKFGEWRTSMSAEMTTLAIECYKARLVAKGFHQVESQDYQETFSPVPRVWYKKLHQFLFFVGFTFSKIDVSLFIYSHANFVAYLLVYGDDIVLTGNNTSFLASFTQELGHAFSIRDLDLLQYFLGVQVSRSGSGLWLSQPQYIHGILTKARILHCKPLSTLMATNAKLHKGDNLTFDDPSLYRQVVGALQYLPPMRPDISFVHTKNMSFFISKAFNLHLEAFTDSDWVGSIDDRKSTGGYAIYFRPNLISWSFRKQRMMAQSFIEFEYNALVDDAVELTWT
ncbi:uncharacterized mitochondrial protein AtMg00810-like [Capsicum annuum]|uniref:uncharacterized mitochondrial protein AtMg00810-like n=1 Tax=Capsicum annuum TaxID=4072 RepID=UPI001FB13A5A|nr:uncharacterized mitochondrial protein AtMg00810-like [Capsicum annuum]